MAGNVERLEEAGVIIKGPLPDAYEDVIEDLSDEEVETIVAVKRRLDEAQESRKTEPYAAYFVPF